MQNGQSVPILQLLLPEKEEADQPADNDHAQQHEAAQPPQPAQPAQPLQTSDGKEEEAIAVELPAKEVAAPYSTATVALDETFILDLLRPQPESETDTPLHTPTPLATLTPSVDAPDAVLADGVSESLPAGSPHDPEAASDDMLSSESSISDAEYERFMNEPLSAPPTFEEMERQVDSLLRLEVRGRRMFPLYMRDQLKLATLTHMRDVVHQLFYHPAPDAASTTTTLSVPVTQHTLHSRLFTFLVKRGSKLARNLDERITILCPEAPAVGEKVPHPQWPEMTTVVRREFAVSRGGEFGIELEDEQRVLRQGKVKLRELFSGLGIGAGGEVDGGPMAEDGDLLIDLDSFDVDAMQFREETGAIPQPAATASETQRLMYESQMEARQHAVAFIKQRVKQLQKRREMYVKEREGGKVGNDEDAKDTEGGTHVLAVVYRFDNEGEEFEIRYPLSKRDVERMQLFEESDDADTVIPMTPTATE